MSYSRLIRGDVLAPLYDNRKQIAPLLAATIPAAVSAVGSLVGNSMNNKAIRENNQMQQRLIEEQKAYNAPDQQVARMRQAGLNPYMMLGQLNSGNQESIAETAPQNNDTAVNGILGAANQAIQGLVGQSQVQLNNETAKKTASEAVLNEIDARTRAAENDARINALVKQGKLTEEQAEEIRLKNDLTLLNWDALSKQYNIQNQNVQADTNLKTVEKESKDFHLDKDKKWTDKERYAALRLQDSSSLLNGVQSFVGRRQANILKHEGNSAYWNSQETERDFRYKRRFYDSPDRDYNYDKFFKFIGPLLNALGHFVK
ncbi:hypothetical protein [Segatella maculosa]|uniref:hypothetical protein n=1 Tax=Segatella maculosa TaxID=439703 RepID=UPI0028D47D79|nr:hypothetical protein [Segatella maculosa]